MERVVPVVRRRSPRAAAVVRMDTTLPPDLPQHTSAGGEIAGFLDDHKVDKLQMSCQNKNSYPC